MSWSYKEFLITEAVLTAMMKWKSKSCAPWRLLYLWCYPWGAAMRARAAKGPLLRNGAADGSGNTLRSYFWRSLVRTSHPDCDWCQRTTPKDGELQGWRHRIVPLPKYTAVIDS